MACARRLAELSPSSSIVVLEADRIGAGNSGRNSGFLLDISFYDDAAPAVQAARTRLQQSGLRELARVVSDNRIACDW
ncbi:MAG: FAD-dependent oxidoreductase, partial [Rhodospirillales bacterium]|nr:FAD-dependent oxidoreductase [Rhodospirillales bacterium]